MLRVEQSHYRGNASVFSKQMKLPTASKFTYRLGTGLGAGADMIRLLTSESTMGPPQLAFGWIDNPQLANFVVVDGSAPQGDNQFVMDLDVINRSKQRKSHIPRAKSTVEFLYCWVKDKLNLPEATLVEMVDQGFVMGFFLRIISATHY